MINEDTLFNGVRVFKATRLYFCRKLTYRGDELCAIDRLPCRRRARGRATTATGIAISLHFISKLITT